LESELQQMTGAETLDVARVDRRAHFGPQSSAAG